MDSFIKYIEYFGGVDILYLIGSLIALSIVEAKFIKDVNIVRLLSLLTGAALGWFMLYGDIKSVVIGITASLVATLTKLAVLEKNKTNTWKQSFKLAFGKLAEPDV